MTDVSDWMVRRRPVPPEPLARWMEAAVDEGASLPGALVEPALAALDRARLRPGRLRESAFELLGADALLTYACEALVESGDGASLRLLLRAAAAHER